MKIRKYIVKRRIQDKRNHYTFRNAKGELLAVIWTPHTQEDIFDGKILGVISDALALCWEKQQKSSKNTIKERGDNTKMQIFNRLGVFQHTEGNTTVYDIYAAPNVLIMRVAMPNDGQYLMDSKILNLITKPLAQRWGISSGKGNRH